MGTPSGTAKYHPVRTLRAHRGKVRKGATAVHARSYPLAQPSFRIAIDPVKNLVGERGGEIGPHVARQVEQCEQQAVEQVGSLVGEFAGALRWRYRDGFLGRMYRCARFAAWTKHARFRTAIPDLIEAQHAGCNRTLGPSAQRGPERGPATGSTEALRRAAASRDEGPAAPEADHGGRVLSYHADTLRQAETVGLNRGTAGTGYMNYPADAGQGGQPFERQKLF